MKDSVYLAIFLLVTSCAQSSINTNQLNSALNNIECYKELFDEIIINDSLWTQLLEIRNDKLRGNGDPITIKPGFRLIELSEFSAHLNTEWNQKCKTKLVQRNDLRGIRIPNKEVIVIEIDKFERYGIEKEVSPGRLVELHRILITENFKNSDYLNFKFNDEKIIWRKELGPNWFYLISQMKTI